MRSIWKGAVSFGLVSISVKMYSATEERDVSFHQVRRSDGSRIRYRRVAEADGAEVAYGDIAKGYSLPSGEIVVLTDEDFADLPLPTVRAVDVLQFVPLEQVDPIYFAKSYYLEPEPSAVKPYVLLRDALDESGMVAVVKVAIRNREQLATLRVREGVIVMETMVWPDEVREPAFAFLDGDVTLRPQERKMAQSLVQSMSGDFDPDQYTDEYRAALQQVIDAKVEGRDVVEVEAEQPSAGTVLDLMAALRASVDAAKRGRGESSGTSDAPDASDASDASSKQKTGPAKKAAPARKVAARSVATASAGKSSPAKSPAKSTPVKSTPVKSTPAKSAPTKTAGATGSASKSQTPDRTDHVGKAAKAAGAVKAAKVANGDQGGPTKQTAVRTRRSA